MPPSDIFAIRILLISVAVDLVMAALGALNMKGRRVATSLLVVALMIVLTAVSWPPIGSAFPGVQNFLRGAIQSGLGWLTILLFGLGLMIWDRWARKKAQPEEFLLSRMDEVLRESTRIKNALNNIPNGSRATEEHILDVWCWSREAARVMERYPDAVDEITSLPHEHQKHNPDDLRGYMHRASQYVVRYREKLKGDG